MFRLEVTVDSHVFVIENVYGRLWLDDQEIVLWDRRARNDPDYEDKDEMYKSYIQQGISSDDALFLTTMSTYGCNDACDRDDDVDQHPFAQLNCPQSSMLDQLALRVLNQLPTPRHIRMDHDHGMVINNNNNKEYSLPTTGSECFDFDFGAALDHYINDALGL